jgi:anaerobic selenocysteine-containing dehydrogenase
VRRRDFLKASAVGAGVSLLEACGGEREQFLIQIATRPGARQGESLWLPSVCTQCAAGCGIRVRVVDGDAKKIEGNPDHPVNLGGVCALGHSSLQELYNPDRIIVPQRRTGARGEGGREALGWEGALGEAAELIEGVSPAGIALVGSDRSGFVGALLRRFADALGAPPPAFIEAPELDVERRAAAIALGVADVPYFDVTRSDYVLSIGSAILDRWRSPVHYTRAVAEMRRGRPGRRGRLVQVEARLSLTAANADEWLPLRPGTEGTFARALAGALLAGGSTGAAQAASYARLFPDAAPSVEAAADACDVPAERIMRIAEALAAAERPVVIGGGSAAQHRNGLFNVAAALGLDVLLGSVGRPGGVYAPVTFDVTEGVAPSSVAETRLPDLAARLRGEAGPPVELLFVVDADMLHEVPSSWGVEEALADVESIVALASFADDTALHADLILPLTTELERFNLVEPGASVGVRALGVAQPVVEPLGDAHHPADVLLALATALGEPVAGRFPWSSFAALARERIEAEAARLPGGSEVAASSYYFDAVARGGIYEGGAPETVPPGPSGPAPAAPASAFDGDPDAFPFVLLPFPSLRTGHGRGANRPWLQEMPDPMSTVMWNSWAELSPADAERLGVRDGDRVRLESVSGAVETHALIDAGVRPGVVGMPLGHGHRDYGRYARGRGANPLDVVGPALVDGTSAPALASTRVRIERVGPGELVRFGRGYTDPAAEVGP